MLIVACRTYRQWKLQRAGFWIESIEEAGERDFAFSELNRDSAKLKVENARDTPPLMKAKIGVRSQVDSVGKGLVMLP